MCAEQLGGIHMVQGMLLSCSTPRGFCISKAYDALRPKLPPLPCYKVVNSGCLLPRHKVILMLAIQRKLATTDLLMERGLPIPNRWSLCREAAESTRHLFFQCSYSKALLLRVTSWSGISSPCSQLRGILTWVHQSKVCSWRKRWAYGSIAATVYTIWAERNRRIFCGLDRPISTLLRDIQLVVSAALIFRSPLVNYEIIESSISSSISTFPL
ncbi:uncharacterized protein LOC141629645 [Silene latifolia]|uniref:uncharacterized protein LOC141629645 n=1 Tax=Silene latifolia TaxID=37657 RepID=UPI003D77240A